MNHLKTCLNFKGDVCPIWGRISVFTFRYFSTFVPWRCKVSMLLASYLLFFDAFCSYTNNFLWFFFYYYFYYFIFLFSLLFFYHVFYLATWTNIKKFIHYKRIFSSFLPLPFYQRNAQKALISERFSLLVLKEKKWINNECYNNKNVSCYFWLWKKNGMTYYQKWPFIICFILINYS